jgi:hypothetical protein
MTYEQTREQFLLAWNSNAYLNMCTSDDMKNVINALDKQIPMEHHHTIVGECSGGEKVRTSICPNCLGCIMTVEEEFPRFCDWCGQAIDWGK